MVCHFKRVLTLSILLAAAASTVFPAPKFRRDDPLRVEPAPMSLAKAEPRKVDALFDFVLQSVRPNPRPPVPAEAVNTLGEVPDSNWFTNRHARRRLTREQLQAGPGANNAPIAPFVIVALKTEGITPGFQMTDAKGRFYFVKPDPYTNPELATSADVIGSRFFYALGYNTPENYIAYVKQGDVSISKDATVTGLSGKPRPMTKKDVELVLSNIPRQPDGAMRVVASLRLPGRFLGPFKYEGTRTDDPNDITPHERRRDLRALHVLCAWLNHTDAKAGNSADTLVEEKGIKFIRHYLIDFGAILGSDSDMPKNARFGNEYILPSGKEALKDMFSFGLRSPAWERADYPDQKAIGRLESEVFDPEKWVANYPNPAHLSRLPDDEYWGAKQVMAFTNDDIRAIVETGQYSDKTVVDYIVKTLIERRDKIGRTYFAKVLSLDNFRSADGELKFESLQTKYGFQANRNYEVQWSKFDNETGTHAPLPGSTSFRLPHELTSGPNGQYYAATIQEAGRPNKKVIVYLRKSPGATEVVGIDRTW